MISLLSLFYVISFQFILICFHDTSKSAKEFKDYSQFYKTKYIFNCNIIYKPHIYHTFYKYIVLTLSLPCNVKYRKIQRDYKSVYNNYILFVYVIGLHECKNIISLENEVNRDILYLNIINHYFNITILFLESIHWININLNYDYLLKWDIDIIVNIPLLFIYINNQKKSINYAGYLYYKPRVCRNKNRICYIPYKIYKYSNLPSFVASGLLILSKYTSYRINKYHVMYKSYMIRDDQYIGVMCNKLLIKPIAINKYYIRQKVINKTLKYKSLLSYHTNSLSELSNIYKLLQV